MEAAAEDATDLAAAGEDPVAAGAAVEMAAVEMAVVVSTLAATRTFRPWVKPDLF